MIQVSAIGLKKIKSGVYTDELPELYELRDVVEDSRSWHKNDSTFDHTLRAWEKIEEVLKKVNNKINSYLAQKVGNHTRRQLLFLGILFHDIGKKDTIIVKDGFTKCPGHEEYGAKKARPILDRFDLSEKEKEVVFDLIRYHMLTFFVVSPSNPKVDQEVKKIKKDHPDIFLELILLSMADTLGTQLDEGNPEEFKFRIDYYQNILDSF